MFFLLCIMCLSSCSTADTPTYNTAGASPISITNTTHIVQPGETLRSISKIYNIDINDLIKQNQIHDYASISTGQTIILPVSRSNTSITQKSTREENRRSFIWPAHGAICEHFKEKTSGVSNKGIDIALKHEEDIIASSEGKVIFTGDIPGYGKTIIIDHTNNLATIYCGSSNIIIKNGQKVTQGMVIAKSGISPRRNQPTLHFEIRKKHKPQNPLFYLN